MACDVPPERTWSAGDTPFFVAIAGNDANALTAYWEGRAAGASIAQPLAPVGFSPLYGMLEDRFGITWVLSLAASQSAA